MWRKLGAAQRKLGGAEKIKPWKTTPQKITPRKMISQKVTSPKIVLQKITKQKITPQINSLHKIKSPKN